MCLSEFNLQLMNCFILGVFHPFLQFCIFSFFFFFYSPPEMPILPLPLQLLNDPFCSLVDFSPEDTFIDSPHPGRRRCCPIRLRRASLCSPPPIASHDSPSVPFFGMPQASASASSSARVRHGHVPLAVAAPTMLAAAAPPPLAVAPPPLLSAVAPVPPHAVES